MEPSIYKYATIKRLLSSFNEWISKKTTVAAVAITAFITPLAIIIFFSKAREYNKSISQINPVRLDLIRLQKGREIVESSCLEGSVEEKALLAKAYLRNSLTPGTYYIRKS